MPDPANPISQFVEDLRRRRQAIDGLNWTPPGQADEGQPAFDDFRLKPLTSSSLAPLDAPMPLERLRGVITVRLHEYLDRPGRSVLVIRAPPGSGKTHATVGVAQSMADHGWRGLWAAGRHSMFKDLQNLPHFKDRLWYHWRGLQGEIDDVPVCRYGPGQRRWGDLGYEPMKLCDQLCGRLRDNYIKECIYRCQAKVKTPLIFGQHQHLVSGLSVSDFDFAIVDELPLTAFIEERLIPVDGLNVGATGPMGMLTTALIQACASAAPSSRIAGQRLFELIGEDLSDVYAQVDVGAGILPEVPQVWTEGEVFRAPYWYVFDLLNILSPEHRAWKEGWPGWNERAWLTRKGLHLLSRGRPWDKLPDKVVVLDATAQPELYRMLFDREVEVLTAVVERQGKVYQVAGRLNGLYQTRKGDELTENGRELLDVARAIERREIEKREDEGRPSPSTGIVCWKALAPHFRRYFGEERVLTFGALRGTNALANVDLLIVAGTFSPEGSQMLDLAAALSDQLKPFWETDEGGKRKPLYRYADREFRLSAAGLAAAQAHFGPNTAGVARRSGYYLDETLDAIHRQLREAELLQALHRARLVGHEATVWLLTSTPLSDEPIDAVYNDPPIGPDGIDWRIWLRLEPWLESQWAAGNSLTYEALSEFAGVGLKWAQRNQWLDVIARHRPDMWLVGRLEPKGPGRPTRIVTPVIPLRPSALN